MTVIAVIAMVLVAWCAGALVLGVVIGRAIAVGARGEIGVPQPRRAEPTLPGAASFR